MLAKKTTKPQKHTTGRPQNSIQNCIGKLLAAESSQSIGERLLIWWEPRYGVQDTLIKYRESKFRPCLLNGFKTEEITHEPFQIFEAKVFYQNAYFHLLAPNEHGSIQIVEWYETVPLTTSEKFWGDLNVNAIAIKLESSSCIDETYEVWPEGYRFNVDLGLENVKVRKYLDQYGDLITWRIIRYEKKTPVNHSNSINSVSTAMS